MNERTHILNVRISERELAMLRAAAKGRGLNQSDMVRQMIRAAYEARASKRSERRSS